MKAQETARGFLHAALLPALLLCGFVRSKNATARKGAALFLPCKGRARRRMSHVRRNLFKEERKRTPVADLFCRPLQDDGAGVPVPDFSTALGSRKRYENAYFITRSGFADLPLSSIGAVFQRFA